MKIIPPQKRTIFIELLLIDVAPSIIEKYKGKIDNYNSTAIFKFNLNIPKMLINIESDNIIELHAVNEINQLCHSPLLNTNLENRICLNIKTTDYKIAINEIYNSTYNFDSFSSINAYYIKNLRNLSDILEFYKIWEKTGKIKLVPFNGVSPYYYKHIDYINEN